MSDGRKPALAGTVIGPSRQAAQTPVTSVAPARERAIRRHGTLSGAPRIRSWILVPHEVEVRTAVALTCVAGFVPERVTVAGRGAAPEAVSQSPPAVPAAAAKHAAAAIPRHRLAGRMRGPVGAGRLTVRPGGSGWARMSPGTPASKPGSGASFSSSAW